MPCRTRENKFMPERIYEAKAYAALSACGCGATLTELDHMKQKEGSIHDYYQNTVPGQLCWRWK